MTSTNRETLEELFRAQGIKLVRGAIFDSVPPAGSAISWDARRVRTTGACSNLRSASHQNNFS